MRIIFLTFLVLCIAYSGFVAAVPPARVGVTVSQEALNRQTVERYRYRVNTTAVIVGSSLAAQFATASNLPCVYDLSIAGGSPLTGLEVIGQKSAQPRIVLVEINLFDRPVDQRFVESPLWFRQYLPITWVENSPVSRTLTFIAGLRGTQAKSRPVSDAMLAAPLRLQQAAYDEPLSDGSARQSVAALRARLDVLIRKGVRPIFFEMPVHPSLKSRVRARQMRSIIATAFPAIPLVRSELLTGGRAVRTTDGIHLDESEAARVLERLLAITRVDCLPPNSRS